MTDESVAGRLIDVQRRVVRRVVVVVNVSDLLRIDHVALPLHHLAIAARGLARPLSSGLFGDLGNGVLEVVLTVVVVAGFACGDGGGGTPAAA